jgi:hypothetical protein
MTCVVELWQRGRLVSKGFRLVEVEESISKERGFVLKLHVRSLYKA